MDFVFTADVDWASEFAIENLLAILGRYNIPSTFFVTHNSDSLRKARAAGRVELGIHPNFLPGSSHGETVDAVVGHVLQFAPGTTMARCHSYLDGTHIATALVRHGICVDSNLCAYMQPELGPLFHWAGLLRLPVFFEDDVHWLRSGTWSFGKYAADFFRPGLKIVNFHPFFVALNIPTAEFYAQHKQHVPSLTREQANTLRFKGEGCATFLEKMIETATARGHRFIPLSALASEIRGCHVP